MYTLGKFSIPEKDGWSERGISMRVDSLGSGPYRRLAPKQIEVTSRVVVAVRTLSDVVVQSDGGLVTVSFDEGSDIKGATGHVFQKMFKKPLELKSSVLVGYFALGYCKDGKLLPKHHFVVVCADRLNPGNLDEGYKVVPLRDLNKFDPSITEVLPKIKPGDEVGWGDPGKGESSLMIWRRGRKVVTHREEEKLAA